MLSFGLDIHSQDRFSEAIPNQTLTAMNNAESIMASWELCRKTRLVLLSVPVDGAFSLIARFSPCHFYTHSNIFSVALQKNGS